ncbi:MAG TPA: DUF6615 family protein [Sphingobium sp.]|nr:DUF6615 family protein [Sphingobium sp.]
MVTMCDLAARLPLLIGKLLDREELLGRGRFREETMTDLFAGSLAAFAGPEFVIEYPIEVQTGGDVDLRFWHAASDLEIALRLQAKRLSPRRVAKKSVAANRRSYHELLHMPKKQGTYQFRTLAATAAPVLPLYMFYNHQSFVDDPTITGTLPEVRGINLAFASDIAAELEAKVFAAATLPRQVLHHKRAVRLQPHFFTLETILCPASVSRPLEGGGVPSPTSVSDALIARWNELPQLAVIGEDGNKDGVLRRLYQPPSIRPSARTHSRLADGPPVRIDKSLTRPRLTFISGRTDDSRTPRIDPNVARDRLT